MTSREINILIDRLAYGETEPKYDLRCQLKPIFYEMSLEEAKEAIEQSSPDMKPFMTITTSPAPKYTEDLNLSLAAAKRISEKNNYTFVLSIEDGIWKACYGDFSDFAEHVDQNPSHAVCMSILKFLGKV